MIKHKLIELEDNKCPRLSGERWLARESRRVAASVAASCAARLLTPVPEPRRQTDHVALSWVAPPAPHRRRAKRGQGAGSCRAGAGTRRHKAPPWWHGSRHWPRAFGCGPRLWAAPRPAPTSLGVPPDPRRQRAGRWPAFVGPLPAFKETPPALERPPPAGWALLGLVSLRHRWRPVLALPATSLFGRGSEQ